MRASFMLYHLNMHYSCILYIIFRIMLYVFYQLMSNDGKKYFTIFRLFYEMWLILSIFNFSTFWNVENVGNSPPKREKHLLSSIFKGENFWVFHIIHIFECGKLFIWFFAFSTFYHLDKENGEKSWVKTKFGTCKNARSMANFYVYFR